MVANACTMGARVCSAKRRDSLLALAIAAISLATAWGQDAPPPPTQTVTPEVIQTLRRRAEESAELSTEAKQQVASSCAAAENALALVDEWKRRGAEARQAAESVADRVQSLRDRRDELNKQLNADSAEPLAPISLEDLERRASQRGLELTDLKSRQQSAETALAERPARRREISERILSAKVRLDELQQNLTKAPPADEPALVTDARRAELGTQILAIQAEEPAAKQEQAQYEAEDTQGFLRLDREVRTLEARLASEELDRLQDEIGRRRAAYSASTVRQVQQAATAAADELQPFWQATVELATEAQQLRGPLDESRQQREDAQQLLDQLRLQFRRTKERIDEIGLSGATGTQLRRQRSQLPNVRLLRRQTLARKELIEQTQVKLFDYDDQRATSLDEAQDALVRQLKLTDADKVADAKAAVETRRETLEGLIKDTNTYVERLLELDGVEQRVILESQAYAQYIDERVLWTRSNRSLFASWGWDTADRWLVDREQWRELGQALRQDCLDSLPLYLLLGFAVAFLLVRRRSLLAELTKLGQIAESRSCTQFRPTLRATWITVLLALSRPAVVAFLAWRLSSMAQATVFTHAVGSALLVVFWVFFPLELLRRVCVSHGLAESHFGWPEPTVAAFRAQLRWGLWFGICVVFAGELLHASETDHGYDALERVVFLVAMGLLTLLLRRVAQPSSGLLREYLPVHAGSWLHRLKHVWYWGCLLTPAFIGLLAVLGYYYTAYALLECFYLSLVFVMAVQLVASLLLRLLLVRRRSLGMEQARQRRAAAMEAMASEGEAPEELVPSEEWEVDVESNTEQTLRVLRMGVVVVIILGLWLIWVDVLPALRILDRWVLWQTTVSVNQPAAGATPSPTSAAAPAIGSTASSTSSAVTQMVDVTMGDVIFCLLVGAFTFVAARNIPGVMEMTLLERFSLDNAVRYAIATVTSYVIILLGVIVACNALHLGWGKVQWLATALTFGLAFGLQEIFANFVAGLILLAERPIRVGDVVTVDSITGVVSRMRIRATTITDWDRKEYVIPNKEFITGRVLNWTLSDKTNRIIINVGVAYGSDVEQAKQLLYRVCEEHPLILDDPPTRVTFEGFGDNSLNLVLRTFLPDLDNRLPVIDDLHTAIEKSFRQAAIEIAFPQRDLHVRSVDEEILRPFRPPTGPREE